MRIIIFIVLTSYLFLYTNSRPSFQSCNKSNSFKKCESVSIVEELLPGTIVDTYKFTDQMASNLSFKMELLGHNLLPFNYLSLNVRPHEVDLVIGSRIDYEDFLLHTRSLSFAIHATGSESIIWRFFVNLEDTDDCYPVFMNKSVTCNMKELDPSESCSNLMISDQDSINANVSLWIVSSTTGSPDHFSITKDSPRPLSNIYVITYKINLKIELDFDLHRLIEIVVAAKDSANHTVFNRIIISVVDVPNKPPVFLNIPYIVQIEEGLPVNTLVTTVSAIDGDRGINGTIYFSFNDSAFNEYFDIHPTSGEITISKEISLESLDISAVYGVLSLSVIASKNDQSIWNSTQTTISIQIVDINNSPATFSENEYNAHLPENSPIGTLVYCRPPIIAFDKDLGANARFAISVLQDGIKSSTFSVYPTIVYNYAMLTLQVINGQSLDYETNHSMSIQIRAKQLEPVRGIDEYSYVDVTISLDNVNDNSPKFKTLSYAFSIPENSPEFTKVGTITATDNDSGAFGNVSYSLIDSSGKFGINAATGEIFVAVNAHNSTTFLDRESNCLYTTIGQVIDGGGLRASVVINVTLQDLNDNLPIFERKIYFSRIKENSLTLVPNIQVKAMDMDSEMKNKEIRYSLVQVANDSPNILKHFSINDTTGSIKVSRAIDREKLNQTNGNVIIITVQAFDPTKPSFADDCLVHIFVEDMNDNDPVFSNEAYKVSIPERILKDNIIIIIRVSDKDEANTSNSAISYNLLGKDSYKFLIQSLKNSSEEVGISINPEARPTAGKYELMIHAKDHGFPSRSVVSPLTITIAGSSYQIPIFTQAIYEYSIFENVSIGTVIGHLKVANTNTSAICSLTTNDLRAKNSDGSVVDGVYNFTRIFSVNATSWVLTTLTPFDRELYSIVEFQVTAVCMTAQSTNQTATVKIRVTIKDVNDNPPIFPTDVFNISLLEDFGLTKGRTCGDVILYTVASDKDMVGELTYSVSDETKSFEVNPKTGQIFRAKTLDREKVAQMNFTVWCFDGIHRTSTKVKVTVLDVNDNEPVFNGLPSNVTVDEDIPIGTVIAKFSATDDDIDEHSRLKFQIKGGSLKHFSMTSDGNLTLAHSLLNLGMPEHTIFLEVLDDPEGPYHLRTFKKFVIFVTLANNRPYFREPIGKYFIPENIMIGFKVAEVSAIDKDVGPNGRLTYSLTPPPVNPDSIVFSLFGMNVSFNRANIFVTSDLKYKAGVYNFVLNVVDGGDPPLGSNYSITITVNAINYKPPTFIFPEVPSDNVVPVLSIPENHIGIISIIQAKGATVNSNRSVLYNLLINDADNSMFSIDRLNGSLVNKIAFDREVRELYKCRIQSSDFGSPSLTAYLNVEVRIVDVDDNLPIFKGINKTMRLSVMEGIQTMVDIKGFSLKGFKIGNVAVALDYDIGVNAEIKYFIIGNFQDLYLSPYSGDLYALRAFDREDSAVRNIGIKAVANATSKSDSFYRSLVYNASDPSDAMLTLIISDINDNAPTFSEAVIVKRMPRVINIGTTVIDFSKYVEDKDEISQGQLKYSIEGDILISSPLNSQLKSENLDRIFYLNFSSGVLSMASAMSFLSTMRGTFQMKVVVNDGQFTSATLFRSYLVADDQRLAVMIKDYSANVAKTVNEMLSKFGNLFKLSIDMDGLEPCVDNKATIIARCTNVYIFGLNNVTNNVVDGAKLLSMFKLKSSTLKKLYESYQIVDVSLVQRNLSSLAEMLQASQSQVENYKLFIIVLSGIYLLIFVISIVILHLYRCYHQRELKVFTNNTSEHAAVLKSMTPSPNNLSEKPKSPFTTIGTYEMDKGDHLSNVKRCGIPVFGEGLMIKRSVLTRKIPDAEEQVIDSIESIF